MHLSVKRLSLPVLSLVFIIVIINGCKHDLPPATPVESGYPDNIAKIFVDRCATAGCHNATSYSASGGLRMDTWDRLFDGGAQGAAIIPYDVENSPLLYYINTDSTLGNIATPRMPYSPSPTDPVPALTRDEYLAVRSWIAAGAPDKNGNIPFAANPDTRQKTYLTEQGCDILSVIDAERKVIMRNIRIGEELGTEVPHCVRIDKAGNYAYISFQAGKYVQKVDLKTDQVVGSILLNAPGAQWNILHVSDDGTKVLVTDFNGGYIKLIRTSDMTEIGSFYDPTKVIRPHGIASNAAFDTFYVTGQYGNTVYRLTMDGFARRLSINGQPAVNTTGYLDPHEIMMTPDHSKYFLTCEASNEIRVMSTYGDTIVKVFNVPVKPQEIAISTVKPYMFFTCMEQPIGQYSKGTVEVINYQTLEHVASLSGPFFQPHGVTVDDKNQVLYVASRNFDDNGPAPHHVSECGGRNGWYTVYDMNTMKPLNSKRYEVLRDPYSFDARFK